MILRTRVRQGATQIRLINPRDTPFGINRPELSFAGADRYSDRRLYTAIAVRLRLESGAALRFDTVQGQSHSDEPYVSLEKQLPATLAGLNVVSWLLILPAKDALLIDLSEPLEADLTVQAEEWRSWNSSAKLRAYASSTKAMMLSDEISPRQKAHCQLILDAVAVADPLPDVPTDDDTDVVFEAGERMWNFDGTEVKDSDLPACCEGRDLRCPASKIIERKLTPSPIELPIQIQDADADGL